MIELKKLCKTYHLKTGNVEAIKNVSLTINDGDVYGVIGYSGAGKSSLIRTINLLETPDSGLIKIDDDVLYDNGIKLKNKGLQQVRKKIGMIFQHFNLLDRSTVFDNIAYALKYSHKSKAEIAKRVYELLELVDLKEKANVYPSQLSGGQKQRVAIARALANNPKVLLSDEATSALDPDATEQILALLKKLNKELGLTIILITHEMAVIKSICSRVAVMEKGAVVEEGEVYEIFANPDKLITKKFISSTSVLGKIDEIIDTHLVTTSGVLVKLQFEKATVGHALISDISRKFNIDVNIVLANVEVLQDSPLGAMIVSLEGDKENILKAIEYLKQNKVNITKFKEEELK